MAKISKVEIIFEKVSLLNYNLWSLRNQHSQKQTNLSNFIPKEKKHFTLLQLKMLFYVR